MTASSPSKFKSALGRVGIWAIELRFGDGAAIAEAATELEGLGFGTLWAPGGVGGEVFADIDRLLGATRNAVVATGIVNIWKHEPAEVGAWWRGLSEAHRERMLLGLGVSHAPLIGDDYVKPLAKMRTFLDGLDAEGVPSEHRCLAALAPKMLELARDRTAGSHPFLITPEHTAWARAQLGPDALLAPEQGVILETDPAKARKIAGAMLANYMRLPNYVNAWRRLGFSEADVTGPSDKLCDALVAWGGIETIAERINAHLAAGADHVCLQVLRDGPPMGADLAGVREDWRTIAKALF